MASEDLSSHGNKSILVILSILAVLVLYGCMEKPRVSVTTPSPPASPPPVEQPVPSVQKPDDAQARAAAAMVRQGRQHLSQGEPDAAIRILERSVALDSGNGENYYYLAEAWLMKKEARHAREFSRLAELRLAQDALWQNRINRQKDRINALVKSP
jgi:Tfp pilus assembly protein PilF